jgi:hypothetical protein
MKLSEYRATYQELSGKASDVARSLAFAGIALVWIFKIGGDAFPRPRPELLAPTALLTLGLAFDLLQYIYSAAAWGVFTRFNERSLPNLTEDPELDAPKVINWPTLILFWAKLGCIAVAYVLMARYFVGQWRAGT